MKEVKIVLEVIFNWYLNPKDELIILVEQIQCLPKTECQHHTEILDTKIFICIQSLFTLSEGINTFLSRRKGEATILKNFNTLEV